MAKISMARPNMFFMRKYKSQPNKTKNYLICQQLLDLYIEDENNTNKHKPKFLKQNSKLESCAHILTS